MPFGLGHKISKISVSKYRFDTALQFLLIGTAMFLGTGTEAQTRSGSICRALLKIIDRSDNPKTLQQLPSRQIRSGYSFEGGAPSMDPQLLRHLKTIQKTIIGRVGRNPAIVFYPAAGIDSVTPFLLFRKARVVIGLDNHRFTIHQRKTAHHPNLSFAWLPKMQMDLKEDYTGNYIILGLRTVFPKLNIIRVIIFSTSEILEDSNRILKRMAARHALVEFNNGPGTPKRLYIHINAFANKDDFSESRWWVRLLQELAPDAVMVKGSMQQFKRSKERDLVRVIETILEATNGMLVEGRDQGYERGLPWEFSGRDRIPGTQSHYVHVPFGYSHYNRGNEPIGARIIVWKTH